MKELILQILRNELKLITEVATVESVDKSANTIEVKTVIGEVVIPDVRLGTTIGSVPGVVTYPVEGSYVAVTYLDGQDEEAYVSLYSEIEEVIIHGGDNGGVIKVQELKKQLDKNNTLLNAILTVIGSPVNEAGNGAPSSFQAALNVAVSSLSLGDFSNLENAKFKH